MLSARIQTPSFVICLDSHSGWITADCWSKSRCLSPFLKVLPSFWLQSLTDRRVFYCFCFRGRCLIGSETSRRLQLLGSRSHGSEGQRIGFVSSELFRGCFLRGCCRSAHAAVWSFPEYKKMQWSLGMTAGSDGVQTVWNKTNWFWRWNNQHRLLCFICLNVQFVVKKVLLSTSSNSFKDVI